MSVRAATTTPGNNSMTIDELILGQERLLSRINTVATGANVTLPAGNGRGPQPLSVGARRAIGIVNLNVLKVILTPQCPCIHVQLGVRCRACDVHPPYRLLPRRRHLLVCCPPFAAPDGPSGAQPASVGFDFNYVGVFSSPGTSGLVILASQSALPVGECFGGIEVYCG